MITSKPDYTVISLSERQQTADQLRDCRLAVGGQAEHPFLHIGGSSHGKGTDTAVGNYRREITRQSGRDSCWIGVVGSARLGGEGITGP